MTIMAYFENWKNLPHGCPYGYMPIPKLIEILQALPADHFISTGWSLPVMTVYDRYLHRTGMIQPHEETYEDYHFTENDG